MHNVFLKLITGGGTIHLSKCNITKQIVTATKGPLIFYKYNKYKDQVYFIMYCWAQTEMAFLSFCCFVNLHTCFICVLGDC